MSLGLMEIVHAGGDTAFCAGEGLLRMEEDESDTAGIKRPVRLSTQLHHRASKREQCLVITAISSGDHTR